MLPRTQIWTLVQLRKAIETRVRSGGAEVDMVGWMGRTALELVGQAGLGYSFDPLVRDKADEYGAALKAFMYSVFFSQPQYL